MFYAKVFPPPDTTFTNVAILAARGMVKNGEKNGGKKKIVREVVKIVHKGVKIVSEKIPKWLTYLSLSMVYPKSYLHGDSFW